MKYIPDSMLSPEQRASKEKNKNFIKEYAAKVQKYDKSYQIPEINTGGCYIATCVYGSYDCPPVWTLRRFRDNVLALSWHGRTLIRMYYAISPTLVRWFGNSTVFRAVCRKKLDKLVWRLLNNGFSDKPYNDRV